MKQSSTILFLLLASFYCFGQSAWQDAITLKGIYEKHGNTLAPLTDEEADSAAFNDMVRVLDILYRHVDTIWGPSKYPLPNDLVTAYANNPFLQNYKGKFLGNINGVASVAQTRSLAGKLAPGRGLGQAAASASPAVNVAMLADGVAKFLVKRTKEELTVAFFEEFQQELGQNVYLQELFPTTRMVLLGIGDQVYNFNAYLDSMREAFLADLKRLHTNLENLLTEAQGEILIDSIPVYYIVDLFKTVRMMLDDVSIAEILEYLALDANIQIDLNIKLTLNPKVAENIKRVREMMRLLYLTSESVRSGDYSKRIWITPGDFRNLLRDRVALDFYLALVFEKAKNLSIADDKIAKTLNTSTADRYLTVVNSFLELGEDFQKIILRIESQDYQKSDSLLYQQYFDYVQVALDMLNMTKDFSVVVFPNDKKALQEMDEVNFVLGRVSAITLDVRRKHYSNAVIQAGLLLNQLILPEKDFSCALLRYGSFMAAMGECSNSDEVANVMETFTLPRGSAYIKKHYPFNLALGSYVGLNAALENLRELKDNERLGLSTGIGAPIGLAFSWGGKSKNFRSPSAFTFYVNVVDIGAFTAYRFTNNDDVSDLPALKFDNLFAPGVALIYGLPKFPGSIGVFTQRGPSLRKVTGTGYDFNKTTGMRFGVMASVDIPLFNLYTKGKKSGCASTIPKVSR